MAKKSAGLLMYRLRGNQLEVFLVHPGGPFWEKKDLGSWSIPKGEISEGEDAFLAAKREFSEETGFNAEGTFRELSAARQPSGRVISAWAFEGNCDPREARSNTFSMEWPPRSGQQAQFPEVDRTDWFSINDAKEKIQKGQIGFIDDLVSSLGWRPSGRGGAPTKDGDGS